MNNTRERTFSHEGRTLTVRATAHEDAWRVGVFDGDRQVTPITYRVGHETAVDAVPLDLVEELMQLAEGDITRKWVKVLDPAKG